MTPPDSVLELVERFERNRHAQRSGHHNETQVRREFIDPFFEALGWDVANKQGYAEAYKDVVHEETLKVGGGTKAPDYGFRIGGARHPRIGHDYSKGALKRTCTAAWRRLARP